MARYLSTEWFEQVRAATASHPGRSGSAVLPDLILRQVVTGGPDGEVRYQIEVTGERATLVEEATGDADMTFTSEFRTAAAIARGELSTQAALLMGRIRVSGSAVDLSDRRPSLGNLDPLPAWVRAETTYR